MNANMKKQELEEEKRDFNRRVKKKVEETKREIKIQKYAITKI